MPRRPANLRYGVADVPPLSVTLTNALQHVAVMSIYLVVPLLMTREAHASSAVANSVLSLSLITMGVATLLQALPKGPVGSGFLAPNVLTAVYIGPSLEAVRAGGLALMAGMTIFGGAVEAALAGSLRRLRTLMPPELAGTVIFLVGITNGSVAFHSLLDAPDAATMPLQHWLVAAATLGTMIALNIWVKGFFSLICTLIGMIVGYAVAIASGDLSLAALSNLGTMPIVALPQFRHLAWSFSGLFVLPFLIAALANTLKAGALIALCQRTNDADWVRPDLAQVGRGVLADGLGTMVAGLLGAPGTNPGAPSVGLTATTGVASRTIAYAISAIVFVLAFIPGVTHFLVIMPSAVIGGTILFTSATVLKNGIETIASRMLDARRTLTVGLAILAGIAVEAFPAFFKSVPPVLVPIVGSALVLGTVVGFLLNLVFRLGIRKRAQLAVDPAQITLEAVQRFMESRGGMWGARRDVILRAEYAVQQLVEAIAEYCHPRGPITVEASFDEFNLEVEARYAGDMLALPDHRPTDAEIREDERGAHHLAGFLLRRNADRVSAAQKGETCTVTFQFDH